MLNELLWFIAGALSSLVINYIAAATFPSVSRRFNRWMLRWKSQKPVSIAGARKLSVGGFNIDWIVLARGQYTLGRIQCSYSNKLIPLMPEFERMKKEFIVECKKKLANNEIHFPYNSSTGSTELVL